MMKKIRWYIHRLKAMTAKEVVWRFQIVILTLIDSVKRQNKSILDSTLYKKNGDCIQPWNIKHNFTGSKCGKTNQIFRYISTENQSSHSTFYQDREWPLVPSRKLQYKGNKEMGDARINWEYNRHHHYPIFMKNYWITKDKKYIEELKSEFYSWVDSNPFLMGISYTSEMELAIRAFSWYMTLELIPNDRKYYQLRKDLSQGIMNLMNHVVVYHSKYSSANNHLIIEMVVLGIVGISFQQEDWVEKSVETLTDALSQQNHIDGINKEQSIHYQFFIMEAVALFILRLEAQGLPFPKIWEDQLFLMCEYSARLMDKYGQIPHLGDHDEGKLLDLYGHAFNYEDYVLQLCSHIIHKNYSPLNQTYDQLNCLLSKERLNQKFIDFNRNNSMTYDKGGHSILKSLYGDKEVTVTFDHAELGFNSIAAHGHADALHITLTIDGEKIFIDPGTYCYHSDIHWRNYFRETQNHNTVIINNQNQSEMKGAFLWGRRATSRLIKSELDRDKDLIIAEHDGYKPLMHQRVIEYQKPQKIIIQDRIYCIDNSQINEYEYEATYVLGKNCHVTQKEKNEIVIQSDKIIVRFYTGSHPIEIEPIYFSEKYSVIEETLCIKLRGKEDRNETQIVTVIEISS